VVALVSGGADSLCLWDVLRELGHPVAALHVDHGLRGDRGAADAEFCGSLGAEVVRVEVGAGGNMEARAREARYRAAREHAAGRPVATGHTLSDQAETVVYRLASSSGPRAVRAMRPAADGLVRPLLCLTAAETRRWCADHGLQPREDETNGDLAIRRNLIRHEVMPALARVHPGAERNLARTAELLGELDRLGLPWAVVTSADPTLAQVRLAAAGITPRLLVTAGDVRAGKPDPEGYLQAARRLAVDPRRCLVVEDAEAGVAAGRAAGAMVAALKGVPADIQIADLYQLRRLLNASGPHGKQPGGPDAAPVS